MSLPHGAVRCETFSEICSGHTWGLHPINSTDSWSVQPYGDAVEGSPEGGSDSRHSIATTLIEELKSPTARGGTIKHGRIWGVPPGLVSKSNAAKP